ncbi:MAG: hypothetical protein ACOYMF_15050 [Bacteroidales bacterium]
MAPLITTLLFHINNPWIIATASLFVLVIIIFLFKFFSVFFDYVQAQGCLTIGLVALVGMPAIIVLCLITGYNYTSTLVIIFAVVGVITGYIARDSEGDVGKFGNFIMIVSALTLVIALFLAKVLNLL